MARVFFNPPTRNIRENKTGFLLNKPIRKGKVALNFIHFHFISVIYVFYALYTNIYICTATNLSLKNKVEKETN